MPIPTKPAAADPLKQLTARYQALRDERTRAEADLKNAQKQLAALQDEARKTWGTDDLGQLQARLEEMKRENQRKLEEYSAHLQKVEEALGAVEQKYRGTQGTHG